LATALILYEVQPNIVGVVGCHSSFRNGEEVIAMETFLEVLKEILKGIVRETSAFIFRKSILDKKKTTQSRRKQKGGPRRK